MTDFATLAAAVLKYVPGHHVNASNDYHYEDLLSACGGTWPG